MSPVISNPSSPEGIPLLGGDLESAVQKCTQEDAERINLFADTAFRAIDTRIQMAEQQHAPQLAIAGMHMESAMIGAAALGAQKINEDVARFTLQGMKRDVAESKASARNWCSFVVIGGIWMLLAGTIEFGTVGSMAGDIGGTLFVTGFTAMMAACAACACKYGFNQRRYHSREEPESSYISWLRP